MDQAWRDPDFAPDVALGSNSQLQSKVKMWLRPAEIVKRFRQASKASAKPASASPSFFHSASGSDTLSHKAQQGALGNCFFVAAATLLAAEPGAISRLVVREWDAARGSVAFRFHLACETAVVEVDDRLPCTAAGACAFAHIEGMACFWLPLLEKAFAKLHGGYDKLVGGNLSECLHELRGTPVLDYNLHDAQVKSEWLQNGLLWDRVLAAASTGWLCGAAHVCHSDFASTAASRHALVPNHAYGVIGALSANGKQLVQIQNPWGTNQSSRGARSKSSRGLCEFLGWSAQLVAAADEALSSGKLRSTAGVQRNRSPRHGAASSSKTEIGDESQGGVFWVTWSDFAQHFNRLYLCVPEAGATSCTQLGEWASYSAGGCSTFPTWPLNPTFKVCLPAAITRLVPAHIRCFITLHQPDARHRLPRGQHSTALADSPAVSSTQPSASAVGASLPSLSPKQSSVVAAAGGPASGPASLPHPGQAAGLGGGSAASTSPLQSRLRPESSPLFRPASSATVHAQTDADLDGGRDDDTSGGDPAICYPQIGVAVVHPNPDSVGPQALCNGHYSVVAKSSFWNKREVTVELGVAAAAASSGAVASPHAGNLAQLLPFTSSPLQLLVVPSSYFPGQESQFKLSLSLVPTTPKGSAALSSARPLTAPAPDALPAQPPALVLSSSSPQHSSSDGGGESNVPLAAAAAASVLSSARSATGASYGGHGSGDSTALGTSETLPMARPYLADFGVLNASIDLDTPHHTGRGGVKRLDLTVQAPPGGDTAASATQGAPVALSPAETEASSSGSPQTGSARGAGFRLQPAAAATAATAAGAGWGAFAADESTPQLLPHTWGYSGSHEAFAAVRGGWSKSTAGGAPSSGSSTFQKNTHYQVTVTSASSGAHEGFASEMYCVLLLSQDARSSKGVKGGSRKIETLPKVSPASPSAVFRQGTEQQQSAHTSSITSASSSSAQVLSKQVQAAAAVGSKLQLSLSSNPGARVPGPAAAGTAIERGTRNKLPIGMACLRGVGVSKPAGLAVERLVAKPVFTNAHDVSAVLPLHDLHAVSPPQPDSSTSPPIVKPESRARAFEFTVVPCTLKPGLTGTFTLAACLVPAAAGAAPGGRFQVCITPCDAAAPVAMPTLGDAYTSSQVVTPAAGAQTSKLRAPGVSGSRRTIASTGAAGRGSNRRDARSSRRRKPRDRGLGKGRAQGHGWKLPAPGAGGGATQQVQGARLSSREVLAAQQTALNLADSYASLQ